MDEPQPPDIEDILAELHEDARGRIKEELLPGERLLWAARSEQDPFRVSGYVLNLILLLSFAAGSVILFRQVAAADRAGPPRNVDLLVALGVVAGIAAVITGIVLAASLKGAINSRWTRSQHLYAITNRRVIQRTPTFDRLGIEVRAIDLHTVGSIHRTEYPGRLGTLTFSVEGPGPKPSVVDPEHGVVEPFDAYRLEKIPDIRRVELLLRQAAAERRAQRADDATPRDLA
jgi:hypothetical protein